MNYKEGDKVTLTKISGKLLTGQAGIICMINGTTIWFKARGKSIPVTADSITTTKLYNSSLKKVAE